MKAIDEILLPPLDIDPPFLYSGWLDDTVKKTLTGMESVDTGQRRVAPLAVVRYGVSLDGVR